MKILFPGRHHLFTRFQAAYLASLIESGREGGLETFPDIDGLPLGMRGPVELLVVAITSADRSNTRRNPFELHYRFAMAEAFGRGLGIPFLVYALPDAGLMPDFASWTLKRLAHESGGAVRPEPGEWALLCSTPVLEGYEALGFKILPAELADRAGPRYREPLAWEVLEGLAGAPGAGASLEASGGAAALAHPDSLALWERYGLRDKAAILFSDAMVGDEGDLTESRDYNSYVREMDEIVAIKFAEVEPYIKPGRIGDIGCAAGSWIRLACACPRLRDSDFYGIEVARRLYDLCLQRASNGDYGSPSVFFSKKNAVTQAVFEPGSMDTIHSSSLTHEIYSYGSLDDLRAFIRRRLGELRPGGLWINRDPIGPGGGDRPVLLELREDDGRPEDEASFEAVLAVEDSAAKRSALAVYIEGLSTFARFSRFAKDFTPLRLQWAIVEEGGRSLVSTSLRAAMEYLLKKDYGDNWESECRESFCHWSFDDWRREMEEAGFEVSPLSYAYRNEWILANRIAGKARILERGPQGLRELAWPDTHMILIAARPL